jgi:hypothetical protein
LLALFWHRELRARDLYGYLGSSYNVGYKSGMCAAYGDPRTSHDSLDEY